MTKATLKLFKAIPVNDANKVSKNVDLMIETIPYGFILDPVVCGNFSKNELLNLVNLVQKTLGFSGEQANKSFHKSWDKVRTASDAQLVFEQIVHYITTYGFESVGVYSPDTVFIPAETLQIPGIRFGEMRFTIIKGLTKEQIKEKLLGLLNSGIALADDTIKDVVEVATYLELTEEEVAATKNKEVKVALYDFLGLVPSVPVEFLRFVVYKAINSTLLIKDKKTIDMIKYMTANDTTISGLFRQYESVNGLEKLASIFYRFKPIFLALRGGGYMKAKVNKIRKLAYKYHRPMKADYFNTITAQVQNGTLDLEVFKEALKDLNIFRKIRLANTLSYRASADSNSMLYKIRNGKAFATEVEFKNTDLANAAGDVIINSIGEDLAHLKGKKFYIPEEIVYALPTTEKQFTGNFPNGSYVSVTGKNLIFGVYWENVGSSRIDLDLSMLTLGMKIGWDRMYRSHERDILFSGDMTDATNGASELYNIEGQRDEAYMFMLNYFNAGRGYYEDEKSPDEVPYKLFIASEPIDRDKFCGGRNRTPYMVDPNNILALTDAKITAANKQKVLGLAETRNNEVRFYFGEFAIGNSMTAGQRDYNEHARRYLVDYQRSVIGLVPVLIAAGALFVETKDEIDVDTIDLSPEALEKDTFIKLLTNSL